ncbi:AI-2E family transporter [Bdellovibrionota bacterium FG-1]
MESKKKNENLRTFLLLLCGILLLAVYVVGPFLLSLLMGGMLAVLSYPVYLSLRRHRLGPKIASGLVTFGIVLLLAGPMSIFMALAIKQAVGVGTYLSTQETFSLQALIQKFSHWAPVDALVDNAAALERQIQAGLQAATKSASAGLVGALGGIPNVGLQIVLAGVACFFFLIDGGQFLRWSGAKIPLDSDVRRRVVIAVHDTTISVIWATVAAATAQSVLMLLGFLLLGVPGAFFAAGATFVFAWIPIVGSFPVWFAGSIYLYLQPAFGKLIVMVLLGLFTGVIDNVIRALVLKGKASMHPLVSLVAIFGAIRVLGFFGVFIGPIGAAILISLLNIWPMVAVRSGITLDERLK